MESQPIWDSIELLDTRPLNELLSEVTVKVCSVSDTPNSNDTVINKTVGRTIASYLPGLPIVGYFKDDEGDFEEHSDFTIWTNRGLKTKLLTQPYGFVSLDPPWYQDFLEDGVSKTYIMCKGYLWTRQFNEASLIPNKSESIELGPYDWDGYYEGDKFIFTHASAFKLCILGDKYEPCFSGSKFMVNYTKKTEEIVTELENVLGRRYCVVDGKLTEKTVQNDSTQVVTNPVHQPSEGEIKPIINYSDASNTSGESSGESTPTGETTATETEATSVATESSGEGQSTETNGEGETNPGATAVGENVNVEEGKKSAEESKSEDGEDASGADSKDAYVDNQVEPGCPIGPKGIKGPKGEPGPRGGVGTEIPIIDPKDPKDYIGEKAIPGLKGPENPETLSPGEPGEPGEDNSATVAAKKSKKDTEAVINQNVTEIPVPTTFSLTEPSPQQTPEGSTVTIPSQMVEMPSADGISLSVSTTGPNFPATPTEVPGEVNIDMNDGRIKAIVEAAVAQALKGQAQEVAQTEAGNHISKTAAQIDAAQEGVIAEIPSPIVQGSSVPTSSDSAIVAENAMLKTQVTDLEAKIKTLSTALAAFEEQQKKIEAEKKAALIQEYIEILGEDEVTRMKTKYSAMSLEDTENLLSLTYARKQRQKLSQDKPGAIQININSFVPESSAGNLPDFMIKALQYEQENY